MDDLLRSVNNKNFLLLNPAYEQAYPLDQSIRVGKSLYSTRPNQSQFKPYHLKEVPKKQLNMLSEHSSSDDEDFFGKAFEYRDIKHKHFTQKQIQLQNENLHNETMYKEDVSEMTSEINSVPMAVKCKNEDVGNYNKNYSKFFEEFYIIGVDKNTLDCINSQTEVVRPNLLFNYPGTKEHSERHKIIKDF